MGILWGSWIRFANLGTIIAHDDNLVNTIHKKCTGRTFGGEMPLFSDSNAFFNGFLPEHPVKYDAIILDPPSYTVNG